MLLTSVTLWILAKRKLWATLKKKNKGKNIRVKLSIMSWFWHINAQYPVSVLCCIRIYIVRIFLHARFISKGKCHPKIKVTSIYKVKVPKTRSISSVHSFVLTKHRFTYQNSSVDFAAHKHDDDNNRTLSNMMLFVVTSQCPSRRSMSICPSAPWRTTQ
jgi:hypothetical protein